MDLRVSCGFCSLCVFAAFGRRRPPPSQPAHLSSPHAHRGHAFFKWEFPKIRGPNRGRRNLGGGAPEAPKPAEGGGGSDPGVFLDVQSTCRLIPYPFLLPTFLGWNPETIELGTLTKGYAPELSKGLVKACTKFVTKTYYMIQRYFLNQGLLDAQGTLSNGPTDPKTTGVWPFAGTDSSSKPGSGPRTQPSGLLVPKTHTFGWLVGPETSNIGYLDPWEEIGKDKDVGVDLQ